MDCLWTTLPQYDLNVFVYWFIIWSSFFAPSWSEYCLFSFSGSTILPPSGHLFKECQEMLMSFRSGILPIWSILFLFDDLSYSGIKSHISKIMSIQSLVVEMKSEMLVFLEGISINQASLVKDPTHTIQCSHLIVLYFENRNDPL
jgi:hypothetical protein